MNESIQVNQWAKITIEVFTKLRGKGVEIESVCGNFSESNLNFTKPGTALSREKPICIEHEIYLDEAKVAGGSTLNLEKLVVKLAGKPL